MPEQLSAGPNHRQASKNLRERFFGYSGRHERVEERKRKEGRRKIGGFGIKLMMERLRMIGHTGGYHTASPAAMIEQRAPQHRAVESIAPVGPTLRTVEARRAPAIQQEVIDPSYVPEPSRIRPQIPREALPPAVEPPARHAALMESPAVSPEPVREGGRHHAENIDPELRRTVGEILGRNIGQDDSDPNVIGSRNWHNQNRAAEHTTLELPAVDRVGVVDSSLSYVEDYADVNEPQTKAIDVPVVPGYAESLPQRTPGELYDPQDDLAFPGSRARHTLLKEEYAAYTPPDPNAVDERYHQDARVATGNDGKDEERASYFGGANVDRRN